jgi:ribonuclease HI
MPTLTIHTDGGARGNPGPAAIGVVFDSEDFHLEHERVIGKATNNVAEYTAVLDALEQIPQIIAQQGIDFIIFNLDSELVVKQIRKEYRVKEPFLQQLNTQIHEKLSTITVPYEFIHVRRAQNALADKLVNHALDTASA